MSSRQDSPGMGSLHCITAAGKVVTSIDPLQSLIVGTFYTILHKNLGVPVQLLQIIQQFIAHADGKGSDYNTHHILHQQSLLIHLPEEFHLGVGIGVSLEISQILHIRIFSAEESLTLLQLLRNRLLPVAIARVERPIVAISTTTARYSPIPIRTREPCVYRNLLNTEIRKLLPDPCSKIVVIQ